jgi:hypothetical protein
LNDNEIAVSLANFPLLGVGDFCVPAATAGSLLACVCALYIAAARRLVTRIVDGNVGGKTAQSLFTPDEIINHHRRFSTLTANIRERRGRRVDMRVPLFRDTNTLE